MFARGSNTSIDRPIARKSKSYIDQQVLEGRADYVDFTDYRKGIIAREMLYLGERELPPEVGGRDSGFVGGLKYIPAPMAKNPLIPRVEIQPTFLAIRNWDWSMESDLTA